MQWSTSGAARGRLRLSTSWARFARPGISSRATRELPLPEPGDLLAVRTVGAYGFTMASNYNGRLRPAETMVDGNEATLIRKRETLPDLVRGEE